jgi:hypothetical protein
MNEWLRNLGSTPSRDRLEIFLFSTVSNWLWDLHRLPTDGWWEFFP